MTGDIVVFYKGGKAERSLPIEKVKIPDEADITPFPKPQETRERRVNRKVREVRCICIRAKEAIIALKEGERADLEWRTLTIYDCWHVHCHLKYEVGDTKRGNAINELWGLCHGLVKHLRERSVPWPCEN